MKMVLHVTRNRLNGGFNFTWYDSNPLSLEYQLKMSMLANPLREWQGQVKDGIYEAFYNEAREV